MVQAEQHAFNDFGNVHICHNHLKCLTESNDLFLPMVRAGDWESAAMASAAESGMGLLVASCLSCLGLSFPLRNIRVTLLC